VRRRFVLGVLAASVAVAAPAHGAPPAVDFDVDGTLGNEGWYTTAVRLKWIILNGNPVGGSCTKAMEVVISIDTPGQRYDCKVESYDNNVLKATTQEITLKVDKTPPAVTAAAARPPDFAGWYRSPVTVGFAGTDAMSGVESCSSTTYAGPDTAGVNVSGTCRDRAGLTGTGTLGIAYDATAPAVEAVHAGATDSAATLRWTASPDAAGVIVTRTPGRSGAASTVLYQGAGRQLSDRGLRNGTRYTYTVTAVDPAGNSASRSATSMPTSPLLAPRLGATLRRPPVLRWKRKKKASYYNVQVYRGKRKVLSAWPRRPRLALSKSWRFDGRRHRLKPGVYQWYVFPGFGERSARRYGAALGARTFRIRR
jgi:hypothetical protein